MIFASTGLSPTPDVGSAVLTVAGRQSGQGVLDCYFFNDVDGNYASPPNPFQAQTHVYADLARHLAQQGHAVLRYARAGTVVVDQEKAAAHQR